MARRSTRRHPASSPEAHGNEDGGLNTKTAPVAAASASDLPAHSLASRSKSGQQDVTATAADSASSASQQVTRRRTRNLPSASDTKMDVESQHSSSRRRRPGEDGAGDDEPTLHDIDLRTSSSRTAGSGSLATRNQWIVLAVASGACAAFNGVFAKLTTNELTAKLSSAVAGFLGLKAVEGVLEVLIRCSFFGLNLAFNGVMWSLFTAALARGNSTTQVQVINTSSNFVLTALLGLALFAESLPPLWWVGASLLVVGTVIVGRKDEAGSSNDAASAVDSGSLPGVSREVEAEPLIYAPPPDAGRSEPAEKEDAVETDVLDLDGAVASSSSSSSGVLIDR